MMVIIVDIKSIGIIIQDAIVRVMGFDFCDC